MAAQRYMASPLAHCDPIVDTVLCYNLVLSALALVACSLVSPQEEDLCIRPSRLRYRRSLIRLYVPFCCGASVDR